MDALITNRAAHEKVGLQKQRQEDVQTRNMYRSIYGISSQVFWCFAGGAGAWVGAPVLVWVGGVLSQRTLTLVPNHCLHPLADLLHLLLAGAVVVVVVVVAVVVVE